ncbi:hypothetical protein, partial [Micrococcus luteus]|uniref:hypothetical protein n=1 Tax=Micrococcus luteus TaxID=1270 RepID=UPI0034426D5A
FTIAGAQLATTQRFQLVEGFTPLQAGLLVAAIALGALPSGVLGRVAKGFGDVDARVWGHVA